MSNRADTFTRTDNSSSPNPPSDAGSNWTVLAATWGIISNRAYISATGGGDGWNVMALDASSAVVDVQATFFGVTGVYKGVTGRVVDTNNYVLALVNGLANDCELYKKVSGSFTQIGGTGGTGGLDNDVYKLSVDASNNWTFKQNGSTVITATDAAGSTATKHGLSINDLSIADARWYAFSIVDNGGGGGGGGGKPYLHYARMRQH